MGVAVAVALEFNAYGPGLVYAYPVAWQLDVADENSVARSSV